MTAEIISEEMKKLSMLVLVNAMNDQLSAASVVDLKISSTAHIHHGVTAEQQMV